MRFANPVDRRRAARIGVELPKSIYASLEHIVEAPPSGIRKLPATIETIEVPEAVKFAAGAPGWAVLNPSVVVWEGELWCCVRLWEGWHGGKKAPRTVNVLGRLRDRDGQDVWRPRPMRAPEGEHYEDLRLFDYRGKLAACGTTTDNRPLHGIALLELSSEGDIVKGHSIPSPRVEKNWLPCVDTGLSAAGRDELRFIYSVDPTLQVLEYKDGNVTPSAEQCQAGSGYLRGSSQLVAHEDGWLAVVHERWFLPRTQARYYLHRFVRFDRALTKVAVGEPFYFRDLGIEFCAGLARWKNAWMLSFGYQDGQACLATMTDDTAREMLLP